MFCEQSEGNLLLFFSSRRLPHHSPPPAPSLSHSPLTSRLPWLPRVLLTPAPPAAASKPPPKPPPSPHLGFCRLATHCACCGSPSRATSWACWCPGGTPQQPSQPLSCAEVPPLAPPVCQVCLKLAELSRAGRWTASDS